MKTGRIIIVSIFVCFLILMIPNVSAIEVNAVETTIKEKISTYEKNIQSFIANNKETQNQQQTTIADILKQLAQMKNNGGTLNNIISIFLFIYFFVFTTLGHFAYRIMVTISRNLGYPLMNLIFDGILYKLFGPDFPTNKIQTIIGISIILICMESFAIVSMLPVYLMMLLLGNTGFVNSMTEKTLLFSMLFPVLLSFLFTTILEKLGYIPISTSLSQIIYQEEHKTTS